MISKNIEELFQIFGGLEKEELQLLFFQQNISSSYAPPISDH